MVNVAGGNKLAVFRLYGTLAALVKESTWGMLLKGEPVGVWEPDHNYWSLCMNGTVIETARVTFSGDPGKTAQAAVEEFIRRNIPFRMDSNAAFSKPTPKTVKRFREKWDIRQGYPNIIHLSAADIERHKRENMDALKLANRMRELIKRQVRLEQIQDELKFGIRREGKD